jgi:alpha-ribazole phosphatase
MTHLFLIRHGETDHNVQKRFQGHSDMGLNQRGEAMANALQKHLADASFSAVFSSDLRRAAQTAGIIAEPHDWTMIQDQRLREMDFGEWEGLTYGEIEERTPDELAAWEADMTATPPPGGETLGEFSNRVEAALNDLTKGYPEENILIVSHGGVLQVICCLAMEIPPTKYWQFRVGLASLSKISFYPQGAIINQLNDTGHLEGIAWEN